MNDWLTLLWAGLFLLAAANTVRTGIRNERANAARSGLLALFALGPLAIGASGAADMTMVTWLAIAVIWAAESVDRVVREDDQYRVIHWGLLAVLAVLLAALTVVDVPGSLEAALLLAGCTIAVGLVYTHWKAPDRGSV